jgi:hypothetical protein
VLPSDKPPGAASQAVTQLFTDYTAAQLRLRQTRAIEQALTDFFRGTGTHTDIVDGEPTIGVMHAFMDEDPITISLENLARHLASELSQ